VNFKHESKYEKFRRGKVKERYGKYKLGGKEEGSSLLEVSEINMKFQRERKRE